MRTLGENGFHVLMGCLVLGSTFVDRALRAAVPTWRPPEASLLTLALGLIWVALIASHRQRALGDRIRVLEDRAERGERKLEALGDELRRR
jgi:hypothetical protein